jgi:HupE / UreJ protein
MTPSRRIRVLVLALAARAALALAVPPALAHAHDPIRETLGTVFVKIEPDRAHVLVRVPLAVVDSARFPLAGREVDLAKAGPAIQRALTDLARDITISEDGRPLAAASAVGRLTLPSDRAFESYEDAVRHVAAPAASRMSIYAGQGFLDAHMTYVIGSAHARFTLRTTLAPELQDYLKLAVRYLPLGEGPRVMSITSLSGPVHLNPSRSHAAGGFLVFGITSLVRNADYVLLLLCLLVPLRGLRHVLPVVGMFTLAHSVTLLGSYFSGPPGAWLGLLAHFAGAAAIVCVALGNILGLDDRGRWRLAGFSGLVYGLQFFDALKPNLQLGGAHPLVALLSFNFGLEVGQLVLVAVMVPALAVLGDHVFAGRLGMLILSAVAGHAAWHWMMDRGASLWLAPWPAVDASGLTTLARWLAALLVAFGTGGLVVRRLRSSRHAALRPAAPSRSVDPSTIA